MVVDVLSVRMSRYKKSMISLRKSDSRFIADLIGFLRRNLSGLKRLPNLIRNDITGDLTSGDTKVLLLG